MSSMVTTVLGDLAALVSGPQRCSACHSQRIIADPMGPLEWLLLPLLGLQSYVCHRCGHGFYSWRYFRR